MHKMYANPLQSANSNNTEIDEVTSTDCLRDWIDRVLHRKKFLTGIAFKNP